MKDATKIPGWALTLIAVAAIMGFAWMRAPEAPSAPGAADQPAPRVGEAARPTRVARTGDQPAPRAAAADLENLREAGPDAWVGDEVQEVWKSMALPNPMLSSCGSINCRRDRTGPSPRSKPCAGWSASSGPHSRLGRTRRGGGILGQTNHRVVRGISAETDREGAITWALARADPDQKEAALQAVLGTWAEENPAAAAAWVVHQPDFSLGDLPLRLAKKIGETDPQASFLWAAMAAGDESARFIQMREALMLLAKHDPSYAELVLLTTPLAPQESAVCATRCVASRRTLLRTFEKLLSSTSRDPFAPFRFTMNHNLKIHSLVAMLLATALPAWAAEPVEAKPAPTFADVRYGTHERNVLDVWLPGGIKPDVPAPMVISIHGGGFRTHDKKDASDRDAIAYCRARGWIYASINYRYAKDGVTVLDAMSDGKRAVQFLRHHAARWGFDPKRLAAYGDSAGAGMCLWIGLQDDMADPGNADPVLRESTRMSCIGMSNGQITYDLKERIEIIFKGVELPASLTAPRADRPEGRGVSMLQYITADDPPVFAFSVWPDTPPKDQDHMSHHPRQGMEVKRRYDALGLRCETMIALPSADKSKPQGKPLGRAGMLEFFASVLSSEKP